MSRPITALAAFMCTARCWLLTQAAMLAGGLPGLVVHDRETYFAIYIALLSVWAVFQCSTIMVAQSIAEQRAHAREERADRRDEAQHAKLDGIILAIDKADNALIGIEGQAGGLDPRLSPSAAKPA